MLMVFLNCAAFGFPLCVNVHISYMNRMCTYYVRITIILKYDNLNILNTGIIMSLENTWHLYSLFINVAYGASVLQKELIHYMHKNKHTHVTISINKYENTLYVPYGPLWTQILF